MLSNYSTKSLEIKAPVLQRDTKRDLRSPVVCWSYQGGCFCRIEGRVDNQLVIGYCMNIIWKLKKKKEKNAVTLFNLRVYTLALLFYSLITVVWMTIKFRPSSFLTFPVKRAAVCKSVFRSDSTLQRGMASVFFTLT